MDKRYWVDEGVELVSSENFMQVYIDHKVVVKTTGGHASSINGKLERPHKTIKNMVRTQLLYRGHSDELWCFYYQYIIWFISCLINMRLGTDPVVLVISTRTSPAQFHTQTLLYWDGNFTSSSPSKGKRCWNN